ncbi:MAG TPA: 4-(cytidine 5'-diphospho)-2-C-methyl-D-erythritol kinase [Fusobacterium sp.]|uniref:4-(cytidine 5'-diphospho)-2-C-methyl-D-erythritol kinase n=1 Tax=Fusobacterium sp. TaxID=68766 RepID=UPI002F3E74F8
MKTYRVRANAKINIGLNILEKKENGYHELDMTMLPISYYDMITFRVFSESGNLRIFCKNKSIPVDKKNILFKVYEKFYEKTKIKPLKIKISLKKLIPSEAGLGGGSSDGAFFLKFLNTYHAHPLSLEELFDVASQIGADLPFFLKNVSARVQGIGEKIIPFQNKSTMRILILKPNFGFSSKEAYELSDLQREKKEADIFSIMKALEEDRIDQEENKIWNHLEQALLLHKTELMAFKKKIESFTYRRAFLTGSGSAYYVFLKKQEAFKIQRKCKKHFKNCEVKLCSFL